jgi:hypothetical protein
MTITRDEVTEALEQFDDKCPLPGEACKMDLDLEQKLYCIFGGVGSGWYSSNGKELDYFYPWVFFEAKRHTRYVRGLVGNCECCGTIDQRLPNDVAVKEIFEGMMDWFYTNRLRTYEFTPEQLQAWSWAIEYWYDNV